MIFVIDIGNSHTVTGIYRDKQLIAEWRLRSNAKSTADELAITYTTLFDISAIENNTISGVIISSVVPTLEAAWVACCNKHLSRHCTHPPFVVKVEKISNLISVALDNPTDVGADRLVNAIAAWRIHNNKQIIIDFGTAITFDCVTETCEYLGGAIIPGIAISLDALANKTAKLPHIDVSEAPPGIIGKSTVHAMKSGILYGYGAMIDGVVKGIKKEMIQSPSEKFTVMATGGMAQLIAPFTTTIETIDPLLTLKGLEYIYRQVANK